MDKVSDLKVYEQCIHRHWCPLSEKFTGADSLVTALHQGWQIVDHRIEKQYRGVSQGVTVYIFTLWSQDNCVVMSVIGNPYVERLAAELTDVGLMSQGHMLQIVDDRHPKTTKIEYVK